MACEGEVGRIDRNLFRPHFADLASDPDILTWNDESETVTVREPNREMLRSEDSIATTLPDRSPG